MHRVFMVLVAVLLVGVLSGGCAQGATTTITGTVHCVSGAPIQGIWISVESNQASPPSGPADWTDVTANTVRFTRTGIPSGAGYSVHVGCGQPSALTNHASAVLYGSGHTLKCGPSATCVTA